MTVTTIILGAILYTLVGVLTFKIMDKTIVRFEHYIGLLLMFSSPHNPKGIQIFTFIVFLILFIFWPLTLLYQIIMLTIKGNMVE